MGWATNHISALKAGQTVAFRPRGASMSGKIESGQLCTLSPIQPESIEAGQIVLCTVKGRQFLHLVSAVRGKQYQISNAKGHINGWVTSKQIYGRVTKIEP